jgi:hypothetical protein
MPDVEVGWFELAVLLLRTDKIKASPNSPLRKGDSHLATPVFAGDPDSRLGPVHFFNRLLRGAP